MKICPVAILAGCARCPAVKICPLKTVLGDYRPAAAVAAPTSVPARAASPPKSAKSAGPRPAGRKAGGKKRRNTR